MEGTLLLYQWSSFLFPFFLVFCVSCLVGWWAWRGLNWIELNCADEREKKCFKQGEELVVGYALSPSFG